LHCSSNSNRSRSSLLRNLQVKESKDRTLNQHRKMMMTVEIHS